MDTHGISADRRRRVWLGAESGDFETFRRQVDRETRLADWPFAASVESNVLAYSGERVREMARNEGDRRLLTAEWADAFETGPGVIVIKGGMADIDALDRATEVFDRIIGVKHREGSGGGDHFAKPGANDRIWNALQKHCLADPEGFARYYASETIALASLAWLGAGYQMTAQVNRVNPGGAAQTPHRDYHLGFMTPQRMENWPGQIHRISPLLTLQGAVAHCDMPLESGPTMLLPYSQMFHEGYIAFGREPFQEHFRKHHVQLPLQKGDVVFFNPALMHGAGNNVSRDIYRMANLLQVSSAFGRAMETVDRTRMVKALYPVLRQASAKGTMDARSILNAVAASAEGYSFPTNLDRDPPIGGLAPRTQAEIMQEAIETGLEPLEFDRLVDGLRERQRS